MVKFVAVVLGIVGLAMVGAATLFSAPRTEGPVGKAVSGVGALLVVTAVAILLVK